MTSQYKENIKALKGPDQFQVQMMGALGWGVRNQRLLAMIAAPTVLAIGIVFAVKYFQGERKESRLNELGQAQVVYDTESRKAGEARQAVMKTAEALDPKPAPTADGKPAAPAPVSPAVAAQKAALQKQADAIKPDHSGSLVKLQEFAKKYPSYPEGWMAGMTAARIQIDEGKLTEAQQSLEDVAKESKSSAFYQTQSMFILAGLAEERGDYDKGLSELDALDKIADKGSDADLKPRILLARGRMQMLKNAKADAKATFNNIIENHGTSPEAQKARSMLSLLNG